MMQIPLQLTTQKKGQNKYLNIILNKKNKGHITKLYSTAIDLYSKLIEMDKATQYPI